MQKAQNMIEILLIAAVIAVASIVVMYKYNDIKMMLVGLSNIGESTVDGISPEDLSKQDPKINIDNCIKYPQNGKCIVHKDSNGDKYVEIETAGTNGTTKAVVYLSDKTTSETTKGCIGMLLSGYVKTCYDAEGQEVKCDFDEFGVIKKILVRSKDGDLNTEYEVKEVEPESSSNKTTKSYTLVSNNDPDNTYIYTPATGGSGTNSSSEVIDLNSYKEKSRD